MSHIPIYPTCPDFSPNFVEGKIEHVGFDQSARATPPHLEYEIHHTVSTGDGCTHRVELFLSAR
ncbi:hypothetical protein, partial [Bacillus thuringiensis]|uniref:hypothetical protein n=1 Tax=Bacillus thuringiensis TaxID=1428 RepID=UPI0020C3D8BF